MGRNVASWIDAFITYTDRLGSPEIFRRWSAITAVAGALERKVSVETGKRILYPNFYTILVGPPGVGKTIVLNDIYNIMEKLSGPTNSDLHIGANNVSRASLIDNLKESERRTFNSHNNLLSFNAMTLIVNELSTLISTYDQDFMGALTDIYDNKVWSEKKRNKDLNIKIENPILNILTATTPSYLGGLIPEGAWDQGFMARVTLIYSGEIKLQSLWEGAENRQDDIYWYKALQDDLKQISVMQGNFAFKAEVKDAMDKWHLAGGPPRPDHPRMINYNVRRSAHLIKLCMISSASMTDSMIVELDHYHRAMDWLIEAEATIPDIFKAVRSGGEGKVMDELWYMAFKHYITDNNKPIQERVVIEFLRERLPPHSIMRVLEVMVKAEMLKETIEKSGRCYIPRPRADITR